MKLKKDFLAILIIANFFTYLSCENSNLEDKVENDDYLSLNADIDILSNRFLMQNDSIVEAINREIDNISNIKIKENLTKNIRNYVENYQEIKIFLTDLIIAFNRFTEEDHLLILDSLNKNSKYEKNVASIFFLYEFGSGDTVNAKLLRYKLISYNNKTNDFINDSIFFKNGVFNDPFISFINTDDNPCEENLDPHLKYWETFRFQSVSENYAKFELKLTYRDVLLLTNSVLKLYLTKTRLLITCPNKCLALCKN
ncbi:MAG: hypothetical protein CVU05_10205 [Bacteroidetes bacterium HGW-Bacteroidetes-21]|jgi:hypothetical protein|nr:MAG: hypothetical protein CVU05_10205 [Bacteroidetes bacterium HGW-Bacteroidetes-21]